MVAPGSSHTSPASGQLRNFSFEFPICSPLLVSPIFCVSFLILKETVTRPALC